MRLINLLQALLDHVRVNLSRRNVGVAQHQLNRTQIRPPLQQVRRKTVTKFMRSQTSTQTQLDAVIVQDLPDADAAKPPAIPRQKQHLVVRGWASGPDKLRARVGQVLLNGSDGLAPDGNQAFLVSLCRCIGHNPFAYPGPKDEG